MTKTNFKNELVPIIKSVALAVATTVICLPSAALSCDLCSIYNAVESAKAVPNTFRIGVAEQFTSFGKVQDGGRYLENEGHQHLESSITQLFGAYDLNEKVSFQLSIPYINRRFRRIEGGEVDTGTEAGIADISLLAKYIPYEYRDGETIFFARFFGGVKLPTGDSDRIAEELEEGHTHEADGLKHAGRAHEKEPMIASAIHGHDLALGSGSYDFPVGVNLFAEHGRVFGVAALQYTFRTRGDFDYEYADDLTWSVGPGYFLSLGHDFAIALKANLSGEYKRRDNLKGEIAGDTGIRSTFLGPELVATAGNWSGEISWDIPLNIENTELQAVPDYKLRAAISYRF